MCEGTYVKVCARSPITWISGQAPYCLRIASPMRAAAASHTSTGEHCDWMMPLKPGRGCFDAR